MTTQEENKINTDLVEQTEPNIENKLPDNKNEVNDAVEVKSDDDFFTYINRTITSVISALISLGLLFGSKALVDVVLGAGNLENLENGPVVLFALLACVSLLIGQSLQNYFVKIIEKESYKYVVGKTFKNFVWQVLVLAVFLPGLLYSMTGGEQVMFWVCGIYMMTSSILSMSIREAEHSNRLQASVFGVFVGSLFWLIFGFSLFSKESEIWKYVFMSTLIIQVVVAEITLSIADVTSKYFKD